MGGPNLSCERKLACSCFSSPKYTIPALQSSLSALSSSGGPLLFVTWWPKWSGGTEDHFGCKWLPWGPPARAPLAPHVALPRAFMPDSSPRIHVLLCTAAYSCTSSGSSTKSGCHRSLRTGASSFKHKAINKHSRESHQISFLVLRLSESIVVLHRSRKFLLFLPFGGGGNPLMRDRELACSCFASPQCTIPALPSSLSALSSSGDPLLFVTWWPKWSGGLSGPEARRATSGASGCRGGLQRELCSQPMSPCRVPSCRSPGHVFAYSCAPPPAAVPAPVHLQSLAAIASEELTRQVQKRLSIKERTIKSLLSLCSCQSPLWCFIGVKFFLFFWPFGVGGDPLMRERAGLLMLRISPIHHTCPAV